MQTFTALVVALLLASPVLAQPAGDAKAQAYYLFLQARRLEAANNTAGALDALKRARTLDPKSAELHAELAAFHARQNDGDAAVEAAQAAVAIDPDNVEANRVLGLVYSAWSQMPQPPGGRSAEQLRSDGIAALQKIIDAPAIATDLNLQVTLGQLQLRAGRAADAVATLEKVVAQTPFAAEPYALLAEALTGLDQLDRAIEVLRQAADLNPRFYEPLAELLERQGKASDAAAALGEAVQRSRAPSRPLRLRWAGSLLNLNDRESALKAREVLASLVESNTRDARALYLLSAAERLSGNYAAAEATAQKLLAIDPQSVPGLMALAQALERAGRAQEGIAVLEPAVARQPENRELSVALADLYAEVDRPADAERTLQALVARDPADAVALNFLGYLLAERGERLPEAVQLIERALKLEPENPSYLDSLGWALFKQGRFRDAEPPLKRAADTLQRSSVIQSHHGDVLVALGRYAEAAGAYERALAGDGEDIDRASVEKRLKDARARQ